MCESSTVKVLTQALHRHSIMLTTAESCTGGMIAAAMTDMPGASAVFDRGFVTYSNEAKHEQLGIPMSLIEQFGAVSPEVAQAMAEGALNYSRADISVAVTGIAGPDGGTANKPVGTVYISSKWRNRHVIVRKYQFSGDRAAIREQAKEAACALAVELLSKE